MDIVVKATAIVFKLLQAIHQDMIISNVSKHVSDSENVVTNALSDALHARSSIQIVLSKLKKN